MNRLMPVFLALIAGACTVSDDPAEGGFFNGIAGLAGGGYDARIVERETDVAAEQARATELGAELARLQSEHRAIQSRLGQQRAVLRAEGVRLSPETATRLQAVLLSDPTEADPEARVTSLRRAIADARRLSEQLADLST